jgi:hypothetical protein
MGTLHELIETHGRGAALAAEIDRRVVDAAMRYMNDEDGDVGFVYSGWAQAALPHRRLADDETWQLSTEKVTLLVEPGKRLADGRPVPVGVPYGSRARLIMLYLQTEAVRTRSREVELGRSMNGWLTTMGVNNGGKGYSLVREQSRRLSLCRLTFFATSDEGLQITNGGFVRNAILPWRPNDDGTQLSLWRERVWLDEAFYASLLEHPLPVREAAIRGLAHRSMAIDLYVWLAYRLWKLKRLQRVPWAALYGQFGAGFTRVRAFRQHIREPLALALAAYPEARVEVDEDTGIVLHPSPPPVPERRLGR